MRPNSPRRRGEAPGLGASSRDRILQAAKRLFAAKGYENTSTVGIARLAGTSESQLMKHFGSKEGLLEAIFDQAWQKINPSIRQATQDLPSPLDKLNALAGRVTTALEKDPELKQLLLLEGRRIRKEGHMILMTQGFLEFVRLLDGVLREMRAAGQLRSDVHLQGFRSAFMGAWEGLMRDQLLARRAGYPARFSAKDATAILNAFLASFGARPLRNAAENRARSAGAGPR